ncbi:hypothetical protein BD309DRAFT_968891 [Dichomitus squalens]|nr:hypothetical protein BD309DRAFT_968891 [Dichomitus squalens]
MKRRNAYTCVRGLCGRKWIRWKARARHLGCHEYGRQENSLGNPLWPCGRARSRQRGRSCGSRSREERSKPSTNLWRRQ